jgi:hypothetical protein
VPAWILADSAGHAIGRCFAVLVAHGLFLEHEPMKPFLYVPVGSRVDAPSSSELLIVLPEPRAVTLRFEGRAQRALARDAAAFLRGERPVPAAAEYGAKWWLLAAALLLALGLAGGSLILSHTAELRPEFGARAGLGFALASLLANAAVIVFSRWSVLGQFAAMTAVCVLMTGLFLFGAVAYLAGHQRASEELKPEPNSATSSPEPSPVAADSLSNPGPRPPPSHVDRAYLTGVSTLDDGPAEVTALTIAPDGSTLGIGHADGTTRLCALDQPTFDAILPGPKADGR